MQRARCSGSWNSNVSKSEKFYLSFAEPRMMHRLTLKSLILLASLGALLTEFADASYSAKPGEKLKLKLKSEKHYESRVPRPPSANAVQQSQEVHVDALQGDSDSLALTKDAAMKPIAYSIHDALIGGLADGALEDRDGLAIADSPEQAEGQEEFIEEWPSGASVLDSSSPLRSEKTNISKVCTFVLFGLEMSPILFCLFLYLLSRSGSS
jgi:hypothetical protein